MRHRVLPLLLSSVVLLAGCAFDADKEFPWLSGKPARPDETPQQNQARLPEAGALIRAGNTEQARAVLDAIDVEQLNPAQQAQFDLLYAQIHLSNGNAEKALQNLDNITPAELNSEEQRSYHESRAFAYSLTEQYLRAAQERIALAPLLSNAKDRSGNQTALLDALTALPESELQNRQTDTPGGWMALALLLKQYPGGGANFDAALAQWQQTYPQHPAELKLLPHYNVNAVTDSRAPHSIAVLLPESGPFAQAAAAIKAGWLAAEKENRGDKPKIRFYNSQSALPGVLYQQALRDGADLVVGPLEKDKLKLLAETTSLTVPVLALNQVPGLTANNLYQFTLSPSDEAEQAAQKAWGDGYRKALILVPNTELGKRVAQAYSTVWKRYGGTILSTAYFDPAGSDFTQPLARLFALDASADRYRQLGELVPGLQFTPRQRSDSEALFINADPAPARALNQQLKAQHLDNIAVYATPHLYGNSADPTQDESLDGITFCDIPWFFPSAYHDNIDATALQQSWKQMQSIYLRLLAMGIDAYNLTGQLQPLDREEYHGATGNLLRLPDGRIRRELFCAKFANGIPEPLGFVTTPGNTDNDSGAAGDVENAPGSNTP